MGTAAAGSGSSCGFNGLFCVMEETKSPDTIEMPFRRLLPFYSPIRWELFLITTKQPPNRMTDPKVNMALYSPIAGSFSHSSNVDIITSIFYRCSKWYAIPCVRVSVSVCVREKKIDRERQRAGKRERDWESAQREMNCKMRHVSKTVIS